MEVAPPLKWTEDGQGRGGGALEMHYTATFPTRPPPQAAGTLFYPMDVDDMPAAGGLPPGQAHGGGPAAHRGTDHPRTNCSMFLCR